MGTRLAGPAGAAAGRSGGLDSWLRDGGAVVVDVDSSRRFLDGHVPGAAWALRTDLSRAGWPGFSPAGWPGRLVLTSADGTLARFAAADVPARQGTRVLALAGGPYNATSGWEGPLRITLTILPFAVLLCVILAAAWRAVPHAPAGRREA